MHPQLIPGKTKGKHDRGLKKAKQFCFLCNWSPWGHLTWNSDWKGRFILFFFISYFYCFCPSHNRQPTPLSVTWRVHWHKTSALFQMLDEVGWVGFTLATQLTAWQVLRPATNPGTRQSPRLYAKGEVGMPAACWQCLCQCMQWTSLKTTLLLL